MSGRMHFGMPTLAENASLTENLQLCRELGLDFIELNMNFPEFQVDTLPSAQQLNALAKEYGVYFTIHLDENMNPADANPLVRQAYLDTVAWTLSLAKRIRAPLVNMHMHHGIYITLPACKLYLYERDRETYLARMRAFRDLCDRALQGTETVIAVENTDGFRDFEAVAIDMLLESPHFRLTWDIGHSKATGERDMPFLMQRKDHLVHFHIHDGTQMPAKNHLALGDGEIDLENRLSLARRLGCRCVLETKTIRALKSSVQWLKMGGWYEK